MLKDSIRLSIGEFAQMCNTTKDTLYHYEKHEILCPSVAPENGYRYYSDSDFYRFQYIAHLRRLGMSVREIKGCMGQRNTQLYLSLMQENKRICHEQIEDLNCRYEHICGVYELFTALFDKPVDVPQIRYRNTEYYYASPIEGEPNSKEFLELKARHMAFPKGKVVRQIRYLLGYYMEHEDFANQNYRFRTILTEQPEMDDTLPMLVKPEGVYMAMYYRGAMDSCGDAPYERVRNYLAEHRFHTLTGLYSYECVGPFYTDDPSEYITKLEIRIE